MRKRRRGERESREEKKGETWEGEHYSRVTSRRVGVDVAVVEGGRAAAVTDALVKKGIAVDRPTEMAVAAALDVVDRGEAEAQYRSVHTVWGAH